MKMERLKLLPRPLRPMNLRSLNLAMLFLMMAVLLRSSPQKFSSLPALRVTTVPSLTSLRAITLNAVGRVLFDLQWEGRAVQRTLGAPVFTSSPGCSFSISDTCLSAHHQSEGYIELLFSSLLLELLHSVVAVVAGPDTIVAMWETREENTNNTRVDT